MVRVLLYVPSHREIPEARASWLKQKSSDAWVDLYIERYDPLGEKGAYDNLDIKSEIARKLALAGEYDYLWNVEDDIILPDDALEKLLTVDKPIVSGLIRGRGEPTNDVSLMARVYTAVPGQETSERPLRLTDIKTMGDIIECTAVSYGCLLLKKSMLPLMEGIAGRDYVMSRKFYALDIKLLVHTGVLCGHVSEWGEVIGVITHGYLSTYRLFDCSP